MSNLKTYTTKPFQLSTNNFSPRNYDPVYLFVKEKLEEHPILENCLVDEVKGGSTPPYYLFRRKYEENVPFVKTSAIRRDFINLNDLYYIHPDFHYNNIKRSITKPFDVIYSMTGKFMGKASLSPPNITEMNMSQNSVVLKTQDALHSAFLVIFLNSMMNTIQITGSYSITKQKYINQGKIARLRILEYSKSYERILTDYLDGVSRYYSAVNRISCVIEDFNKLLQVNEGSFDKPTCYTVQPNIINKKIMTPQYYRKDFINQVEALLSNSSHGVLHIDQYETRKGDEIGSANYDFEGIPFIKTSDFLNYGVDYQPNYYCTEAIYGELEQDLRRGDLLITKDGKVGETAIIEESARLVISSGIVRIRTNDEGAKYWLFLLLSSLYGRICFKRWTVIASTMAHLRKDFFIDSLPLLNPKVTDEYIPGLKESFSEKRKAYDIIESSKDEILCQFRKYTEQV